MAYDPVKAHEYYLRTRQLKGDEAKASPSKISPRSGSNVATSNKAKPPTKPTTTSSTVVVKERVIRLKGKVDKLQGALTEALNALSEKRQNKAKEEKANSDGKTTVKERQAAKDYRERNQAKIAEKRKQEAGSGGGSSSSTRSVSSMSESELITRVDKIRTALSMAREQLASAQQALGELSHSALAASGNLDKLLTLRPTISRKDSVKMTADFSGYATRNNLRCSDGRTILADAFKDNDNAIVPLLWQHGHDEPTNVLGHVKLENRQDGVYAHAFFNKSAKAQHAKEAVANGDIRFLSIFANQLVERAKQVVKGNIREVSLVVAGANPGATIDYVNFAHGVDEFELFSEEGYITTGMEIEPNVSHAATATEDETQTVEDVLATLDSKQQEAVYYLLSQALTVGSGEVKHDDLDEQAADDGEEDSATAASDENTDEAAEVVADGDAEESTDGDENEAAEVVAEGDAEATSDEADNADSAEESTDGGSEDENAEDSDNADGVDNDTDSDAGDAVQHNNQEDNSMTHNVFDQAQSNGTSGHEQLTLSHSDVKEIVGATLKTGSLKAAVEDYALAHGIENIEYLFPDAKLLEASPNYLSRRMEWVQRVLDGVRRTPFARIKTVTADITADEARAKGYVKGNFKEEEFFTLLKRETTPQTVYKKQKLDRDDVIDITDLDVIAWVKAEMKLMLDEELAGAILIGDGRSSGDDDKIKEDKIRPIASDAELYVTTVYVNLDDASSSIEELVDKVIASRQYWKGTGTPSFYTSEAMIAAFLNVKNGFGQRIYKNLAEVAEVLRVREIVPVDVFTSRAEDVAGIMVNLADYSIGTDRGGQATMFDDFDLDYNKLIYLLETRLCGALTLPKSALVFRKVAGSTVMLAQPTEPTFDGEVVTVPTVANVTYKNADTDATLTTGSPVTLDPGETLNVVAVAASGYTFPDNANDEWSYTNEG